MAIKVGPGLSHHHPLTPSLITPSLSLYRRLFLLVLSLLKRIRATIDPNERKRLLMDVNVAMKSLDCPYTVTFYGTLFHEVNCESACQSLSVCLSVCPLD